VEKVEYSVTPEKAKTLVEFGTSTPNMGDQIAAGGSIIRNDISGDVLSRSTNITNSQQAGDSDGSGSGTFPLVGELISQNTDGTWEVEGRNGEVYSNVEVI